MAGILYQYLSGDHASLDALLKSAAATPGLIDMDPYSRFRKRLLRHISMEEKIVLPAIAKRQGGEAERPAAEQGPDVHQPPAAQPAQGLVRPPLPGQDAGQPQVVPARRSIKVAVVRPVQKAVPLGRAC